MSEKDKDNLFALLGAQGNSTYVPSPNNYNGNSWTNRSNGGSNVLNVLNNPSFANSSNSFSNFKPAAKPYNPTDPNNGKANEHYQQLLGLYNASRLVNVPHYYAKANAIKSRTNNNTSQGISSTAPTTPGANIFSDVSGTEMFQHNIGNNNINITALDLIEEYNSSFISTIDNNPLIVDSEMNEDLAKSAGPMSNKALERKIQSLKWTKLDLSGVGIKCLSLDLTKFYFLTHLHLNNNRISILPKSIGDLTQLRLLDLSGNYLTYLPHELGFCTKLRHLLLFDNSLVYLPYHLGNLYRLKYLGIEGNPIAEPIRSLIVNEGTEGVITYLRDNGEVPAKPKTRKWESIGKIELFDTSNKNIDKFKHLSYNILSDKLASPSTYGYTPSWALNWDYRKDLILKDILLYEPEIICLQEVEQGQYQEFFKPKLESNGYDGIFWSKSRAKNMTEKEKKVVDGCATFYKKSNFSLVQEQVIEFSQVAMHRKDFKKTDSIFTRFLNKDNISGIIVLDYLSNNSKSYRLLIANAHIHWDPEYSDVKLVQVAMLTGEIEKIIKNIKPKKSNDQDIAVIISGDFNSLPDSSVVQFLNTGSLNEAHPDMKPMVYGQFTSSGLNHSLNLKSAYPNIINSYKGDEESII